MSTEPGEASAAVPKPTGFGEYLSRDRLFAPDRILGDDEVPIVIACFIEAEEKRFKAWLAENDLSFECGFRDWLRWQERRHARMSALVELKVRPRGFLANYPRFP